MAHSSFRCGAQNSGANRSQADIKGRRKPSLVGFALRTSSPGRQVLDFRARRRRELAATAHPLDPAPSRITLPWPRAAPVNPATTKLQIAESLPFSSAMGGGDDSGFVQRGGAELEQQIGGVVMANVRGLIVEMLALPGDDRI